MECLVTKLKGVVNSDNLVKLGGLRFHVFNNPTPTKSNRKPMIVAVSGSTIEMTIIGDGYFIEGTPTNWENGEGSVGKNVSFVQSKTNINNCPYYLSNGNYIVEVTSKYDFVGCTLPKYCMFDFNQMSYMSNLTAIDDTCVDTGLDMEVSKRNVELLYNLPLLERFESFSTLYNIGNIGAFKKFSTLKKLNIYGCKNLEGSINELGALTNIEDIRVGGGNVTGSYDGFIRVARNNGRTTGDIVIGEYENLGTGVKFGNKTLDKCNAETHLIWDNTKIAVAMNAVSIDAATKVFVIGYSDSEIQSLTDLGKTVVKCD